MSDGADECPEMPEARKLASELIALAMKMVNPEPDPDSDPEASALGIALQIVIQSVSNRVTNGSVHLAMASTFGWLLADIEEFDTRLCALAEFSNIAISVAEEEIENSAVDQAADELSARSPTAGRA